MGIEKLRERISRPPVGKVRGKVRDRKMGSGSCTNGQGLSGRKSD